MRGDLADESGGRERIRLGGAGHDLQVFRADQVADVIRSVLP